MIHFYPKNVIHTKKQKNSNNFYLEATKYGGHVGFMSEFSQNKNRWLEKRIIKFLTDNN